MPTWLQTFDVQCCLDVKSMFSHKLTSFQQIKRLMSVKCQLGISTGWSVHLFVEKNELLMGLNENVHDRLKNRNRLFKLLMFCITITMSLWLLKKCAAMCPSQKKLNTGQRASECIQLDPNGSSVGHCGLIKYTNLANESFNSSTNTWHVPCMFMCAFSDLIYSVPFLSLQL